jgi:Zn-dependent protease
MPPPQQGSSLAGSFRIFTVAGISVYIHWSWLVVAYLSLQFRDNPYNHWAWNVAEYLAWFAIVLMHEFGHSLACRQVGGKADEIVLWPLGGIAFVSPPPRPGAVLWSIAAGPLVNLVLVPFTIIAYVLADSQGLEAIDPDAYRFVFYFGLINFVLFVFNMLPIYPLDGGQILQSLLWFVIGRSRALLAVSILGLVCAVAVVALALVFQQWWFVVIAVFVAFRCIAGFRQAQLLARLETAPRHRDAACPSCGAHPLMGPFWECAGCQARVDAFENQAECPECGREFTVAPCPECGRTHPIWAWYDADEPPTREEPAKI